MTTEQKLQILDSLIERADKITYRTHAQMEPYKLEAETFVRNAISADSYWMQEIKNIHWGGLVWRNTDDSEVWYRGKVKFLNILGAIKSEVELYANDEPNATQPICNADTKPAEPSIFLGHTSADSKYGNALAALIRGLGVKNHQLVYTSHPLHGIPTGEDIYDYLRSRLGSKSKVLMIFLWSDAYLDNPICLNEMGAAWMVQSDYINMFVPHFSFAQNPKFKMCAVNTNQMGTTLNGGNDCRVRMVDFRDKILEFFGLEEIEERQWTILLSDFIEQVSE